MGNNANKLNVDGKKTAEQQENYIPISEGGDCKRQKRDTQNARIVKRTAKIMGVSKRYVYYILEGNRTKNEQIFACYMALLERDNPHENELLEAVKKLYPFDLN